MRVRVFVLVGGLAAALAGSAAFAAEPVSAWAAAGAPLKAAGSFVPPPPGTERAVADGLQRYALYGDDHSGGVFDEVRVGVLGFWQNNSDSVQGVYFTGQVLFDPVAGPFDNWILNFLLTPRPHVGATYSPDGPDQLFAGATWTVPIWRNFFAEASFGGTIHNGKLSGAEISLGCHALFRESLAVGADLGQHWRVLAGVDHSSHAGLCDGENDGLTHLGGYIAYRF